MIRIFKEIWNDLFTSRNDIYPAKKPTHAKISKKTKSPGKVAAPVGSNDQYAEIIDDYPTYHRNKERT